VRTSKSLSHPSTVLSTVNHLISVNNTRDNEEADTTIVVHIVDSLQAGSQIRTANTDIVTIPN
jgi:hypothetical protein